jgi:hypothetical protein
MRCTFRAALAALSSVLIVLVLSPVMAPASVRQADLLLKPSEGLPGSSYIVEATGAISCPNPYSLHFDDVPQPFSLKMPTANTAVLSSDVPTDANLGPQPVTLYCTDAAEGNQPLATATFEVLPPPPPPPPEEPVPVPDLTDKTVAQARVLLADVGLKLGEVTGGQGKIVGQSPKATTPVLLGTSVNVTLAVIPLQPVVVPNLIGRTLDEARELLKGKRLKLGAVTGSGRVASQKPAPGALVKRGSAVAVTLRAVVPPSSPTPSSPSPISPISPPSTGTGETETRTGHWILVGASGSLGGVLLLGAAALLSRVAVRARERHWVRKHVEFAAQPGDAVPAELRTDPRLPTSEVRLEPHPDAGSHLLEEVP